MPPTIFAELDSDWATLAESAAVTTALRRWQREEPALAPFPTMTALVQAAHRRGVPAECDRILVALARRAGSDGLAARTLLQLLLPGARALARRLWWLGGPEERAAAVVGALYERIRTYPLDRRPAKVALELVRGRPLESARPGSYEWTVVHQAEMEAQIAEVAEQLADRRLEAGDHAGATWAARRGLRASPDNERLYRVLLRAAHAAGNLAGVHAVWNELLRGVDDDMEPFDSLHPETVELYQRLVRPRRRPAVS